MPIITKVVLGVLTALILVVGFPHALNSALYSFPAIQNFLEKQAEVMTPTQQPPLQADSLIDLVNEIRVENSFSALKTGKQTCAILNDYEQERELTEKKIAILCPTCEKVQIISLFDPIATDSARDYFTQNATVSSTILQKDFTHICAIRSGSELLTAFVSVAKVPVSKNMIPKNISEDELWKSLGEYRRAQGKSELSKDEKLCVYARKRVEDHRTQLREKKPKEAYSNPDKYPLDAHEGFKKDADSGYVFDVTERSEVAENLAYWPNAEHATHVIEWGWDQSKEGHREAQLSNDFSAGCLTGKDGFFVAIFAR